MEENYNSSPYTEKYILEALFLMGRTDEALARIKKRYQKMVDSPITTLWEGWGIGQEGYGGGSYNHGWAGGPLTLMMQYIAGISPDAPGWDSFRIAPQLGKLNSVDCDVPTPHGRIKVNINKSAESYLMEAFIPEKQEGKLILPVRDNIRRIEINNTLVNQQFNKLPKGVNKCYVKNGKLVLIVKGINAIKIKIEY